MTFLRRFHEKKFLEFNKINNKKYKKFNNNNDKTKNKEIKFIKIRQKGDFPPKKLQKKNLFAIKKFVINNNKEKNISKMKAESQGNSKKALNKISLKNSKSNKTYNRKNIQILSYNDNELNDLPYEKAIKSDKRNFIKYYLSLLKTKHPFVFSFYKNKNDYNSPIIKIYLFFQQFLTFYAINALFFNDSTMHQFYIDEGFFDIGYQIPQIIYSWLISSVINIIITKLGLSEENIIKVKNAEIKMVTSIYYSELKILKIKFIFFFIINLILLISFWFYLACFCIVFENTQINLIKDSVMSFSTSLISPFIIYLLPGIFRIPSLKNIKSKRICMYNFSKILQTF